MIAVCHECFKTLPMSIIIGKSPNHIQDLFLLRNLLPRSLKVSNHSTHGSKVFGDTTTGVYSILHPSQLQGTQPCSRRLPEPNLKLYPHVLSSAETLKLSQEIVPHARQHGVACGTIAFEPCLVCFQVFFVLLSCSNISALFISFNRRNHGGSQVVQHIIVVEIKLNL